ncbi:MAG: hypothetical protein LBE10_05580 [Treponema sp.]|jgi:hypothetical protein|nr:hypothetical protein [Treponema sp.]
MKQGILKPGRAALVIAVFMVGLLVGCIDLLGGMIRLRRKKEYSPCR